MGDRLGIAACPGQAGAQVQVGCSVIGLDPESMRKPADCLLHPSLQIERQSQVVDRTEIVRLQTDRFGVVSDCLFVPSLIVERLSQKHLCRGVVRGDLQRVFKQRYAVAPIADLLPGHGHQRTNADPAYTSEDGPSGPRQTYGVSNPPGSKHEDAHEGHIGVTIRHRLRADLDQADHWYQCPYVPKPANDQVRASTPHLDCDSRHNSQQQNRSSQVQARCSLIGVRVIHRQSGWPDRLPKIADVGDQGVAHTGIQRDQLRTGNRATALLCDYCHNARRHHQRDKWELLPDQPPPCVSRASLLAFDLVESPERPVVQKKHHARPGNQHRLGHQPQCQQDSHNPIAVGDRSLRVSHIGKQRQKTEEGAQDVFPLGYPGHRLDVKWMHAEQGGHKRAGPYALCHPIQNGK